MENRAFGALVTALLLGCAYTSAAGSEPLRVLYAEPFQAQTQRTPGAQKPGPANLRVQAFGRAFELELEDNSRLLRATSAATRARFGAVQLLKGTIKDAPGSWVRLSLSHGRYSGAFWDGSELYAVAPREELDSALLTPMPAAATGIYRLSDTQGGLFSGTCAVAGGSVPSSGSPTAKFRALIGELRTAADAAFADAPREIEISMIGDFEFTAQFGSGAADAMLLRMNMVDGIFSSQVGVTTIPTDFITFNSNTDPFTSSEPSTLLEQLGNYRNATALVRSRGLAHLLTGRRLNGNIIGIAYLGGICSARNGAGLSEVSPFIDSIFVIAHEIGHNFGAPHDGEAGSPCVNTPQTFLMAPELNNNGTFSDCSLQQIQTRIQTASCVVAARNRDLAVSVPSADIQTVYGRTFDYVVDVDSVGDFDAVNGVLSIELSTAFDILSVSMPGATCNSDFTSVHCELGDLAPGQNRHLALRLRATSVGDFTLVNSVISSRDVNAANDSRSVDIHVAPERAIQVAVTPHEQSVTTGEIFEIAYDVIAAGALPLNDVRADINGSALVPTAVTVDSGTCTIDAVGHTLACQLGTIAPGSPRRIRVQWTSEIAGQFFGTLRVHEAANPSALVFGDFVVTAQAARDITLTTPQVFQRVAIDHDATYTLQVESRGVNAVDDVHIQLVVDPAVVTLAIDGPLASSCTLTGDTLDCAMGTIPAQTTRTVTFRARAGQKITTTIHAHVVLPTPDNFPYGEDVFFSLDVGVADEIQLVSAGTQTPYDEQVSHVGMSVYVAGVNPSENVHVAIALPTGFVTRSAAFENQPCTIDAANSYLISCTLPRLEPLVYATVSIEYIAPDAGVHTATIAVSADHDTDLTNNEGTVEFQVQPNVDGRLIAPPPPERARSDLPIDLVFTVATGKRTVPDAQLFVMPLSPFDEFSLSAPGATCGPSPNGSGSDQVCEWPSLPGNSTVPVTLHARSARISTGVITAAFVASVDTDPGNNNAYLSFPIVVAGDIGVNVTLPVVTATVDEFFDVPGINLVVLARTVDAVVDLTFDPARLEFVGINNGSCIQLQVLRCQIFDMDSEGTHPLFLQVRPRGTGAVPISIRVSAFNDFNPANDEQMMTVTIVEPPPPPPPPPPSGGNSGGGGGGGSMDWWLAALLLMMWHHRRARSRVHR